MVVLIATATTIAMATTFAALHPHMSFLWIPHDSPAFRVDRDPIKAGFIVINRQIRLNFPLERRTSTEEEIKPILFNPHELKSNLHGNQVSSKI